MSQSLSAHPRAPLRKRPLDCLWFVYLVMHIPATVLIDAQLVLLPPHLTPKSFSHLAAMWVRMSNDPLIVNVKSPAFAWFRAFNVCEMLIQLPIFVFGSIALWRNDKRVWPLLLLYSAHGATTTLACVAEVNALSGNLTTEQYRTLMSAYLPYLVTPVLMAIDMLGRIVAVITRAGNTGSAFKAQKLQ